MKASAHPALNGIADVLLGGDNNGEGENNRRCVVVVELVDEVIIDARVEALEYRRQIVQQHTRREDLRV